jgi:hypothetical protein
VVLKTPHLFLHSLPKKTSLGTGERARPEKGRRAAQGGVGEGGTHGLWLFGVTSTTPVGHTHDREEEEFKPSCLVGLKKGLK